MRVKSKENKRRRVDGRSGLRQALDANRAVIQHKVARRKTWRNIRDDVVGGDIETLQGCAISVDTLARVVRRAGILTDDPDPAAPSGVQVTTGWYPEGGALHPTEPAGDAEPKADRARGQSSQEEGRQPFADFW